MSSIVRKSIKLDADSTGSVFWLTVSRHVLDDPARTSHDEITLKRPELLDLVEAASRVLEATAGQAGAVGFVSALAVPATTDVVDDIDEDEVNRKAFGAFLRAGGEATVINSRQIPLSAAEDACHFVYSRIIDPVTGSVSVRPDRRAKRVGPGFLRRVHNDSTDTTR